MNKKAISILIVFLVLIGVSTAFLSQLTFALGNPGVRLAEMQIFNETNQVVRTNGVALPPDVMQCVSEATPITTKELDWLPEAQVTLQAPQAFQLDSTQSTGHAWVLHSRVEVRAAHFFPP